MSGGARSLCIAVLAAALAPTPVQAGSTALIPPDSNSRITVLDARAAGGGAEVLYETHPDFGDPQSGTDCPLNVYAVRLRPGLAGAEQRVVAQGLCSFIGNRGRLQPDGSALLLVGGAVEHWKDGRRLGAITFDAVAPTSGNAVEANNTGQQFDLASNGDLVVAVPRQEGRNRRRSDRGADVIGLDAAGRPRWSVRIAVPGEQLTVSGVWAGADGGALVRAYANRTDGSSMSTDRRLYAIGPRGTLREPVVIGQDKQLSTERMANLTPEEKAHIGELLKDTYMEGISDLDAFARPDGGFDVLLDRNSGPEERDGQFLYRIGPDGRARQVLNLTAAIEGHGLENWVDFRTDGDRLVLLGEVSATQPVQARRKTWDQIAISWLDLGGGPPLTRVVPLNREYLEAVLNARGEEMRAIDNRPGGQPALLGRLGGTPLAVSVGYLQGRDALRLDEATDDLVVWDEHYQESRRKLAKEEARQRRRAQRQARQRNFQADVAAAAGMTPEEFEKLSNKEQAAAMIKSGNMNAITAAAQRQAAEAVQQAQAEQQAQAAASGQPLDPQTAAAMQQAIAALQAAGMDPGALSGALGSAQQGAQQGTQPGTAGGAPASGPGAKPGSDGPDADKVLKLDASQRGFIDYEAPGGEPVTLLIAARQGGRELLRKDYPDGAIYEYVDFGRFDLPLAQIRVRYLDADGATLKELTPVVAR